MQVVHLQHKSTTGGTPVVVLLHLCHSRCTTCYDTSCNAAKQKNYSSGGTPEVVLHFWWYTRSCAALQVVHLKLWSRRYPHFHLLAYGQQNTASGA